MNMVITNYTYDLPTHISEKKRLKSSLPIYNHPCVQKLFTNQNDLTADLWRAHFFCGWKDLLYTLPVCNEILEAFTTKILLSHDTQPKSRRTVDFASKAKETLLDWAPFSLNLDHLCHTELRHGLHTGHRTTLHQSQPPLNSPRFPCHPALSQQRQLMRITAGTVTQYMLPSSHVLSESSKRTPGDPYDSTQRQRA